MAWRILYINHRDNTIEFYRYEHIVSFQLKSYLLSVIPEHERLPVHL